MKKNRPSPPTGKMIEHGEGAGVFSPADVDARAAEIASTEGRTTVRPADRARAARELRGRDVPPTSDQDANSTGEVSRDPSEPPSDPGTETTNLEPDDEQMAAERLVNEGVDEAQHDQMIAARRRREP